MWQQVLVFWRANVFSPRGFVLRALVVAAAFLVVHIAGLRDYTSILNGTVGPGAGRNLSAVLGIVYLVFYMAAIVFAPMLLLAAGILALWEQHRLHQ